MGVDCPFSCAIQNKAIAAILILLHGYRTVMKNFEKSYIDMVKFKALKCQKN